MVSLLPSLPASTARRSVTAFLCESAPSAPSTAARLPLSSSLRAKSLTSGSSELGSGIRSSASTTCRRTGASQSSSAAWRAGSALRSPMRPSMAAHSPRTCASVLSARQRASARVPRRPSARTSGLAGSSRAVTLMSAVASPPMAASTRLRACSGVSFLSSSSCSSATARTVTVSAGASASARTSGRRQPGLGAGRVLFIGGSPGRRERGRRAGSPWRRSPALRGSPARAWCGEAGSGR